MQRTGCNKPHGAGWRACPPLFYSITITNHHTMKKEITNAIIEAYEKESPKTIEVIKKLLAEGLTPTQIEKFAKRAGSKNPEAWYLIAEKHK